MFEKLRKKFITLTMVIISLVMIGTLVVIYISISSNINAQITKKLERATLTGVTDLRDPLRPNEFKSEFASTFNIFLSEDKTITKIDSMHSYEIETYYDIANKISLADQNIGKLEIENKIWQYKVIPIPKDKSIKLYGSSKYKVTLIDITDSIKTLNDLLLILISISIILLILIYFISLYFAKRAIEPIEAMWGKQKNFISDVTHELKTPLTIIKTNTDLILSNKSQSVKKQLKPLNYIKDEIIGMDKLVNELLKSAKVEEEHLEFKTENISNIVTNSLLIFENKIMLNTNKDKLIQVLKILFDNALKYTDESGIISVSLYHSKRKKIIKIENSGRIIPQEDLEYIFDRFYKCDKARTNSENSYGLGLHIAKTIINKLNGKIYYQTTSNLNSFIIEF